MLFAESDCPSCLFTSIGNGDEQEGAGRGASFHADNLVFTWKIQHREEAIALMRKCVQLRGRVLGSDHPFTLSSREALIQ